LAGAEWLELIMEITLPLQGRELSSVSFDFAVTFGTAEGDELKIETPFVLHLSNGEPMTVDPESAGDLAANLLDLIHQDIVIAEATEAGALSVHLSGGAVISVRPDGEYEAWTFAGASGAKVVCRPGGELSTWGMAAG
jgi:hypothetical protein